MPAAPGDVAGVFLSLLVYMDRYSHAVLKCTHRHYTTSTEHDTHDVSLAYAAYRMWNDVYDFLLLYDSCGVFLSGGTGAACTSTDQNESDWPAWPHRAEPCTTDFVQK